MLSKDNCFVIDSNIILGNFRQGTYFVETFNLCYNCYDSRQVFTG